MTTADFVGFAGVSMILIAFILNLTNLISTKSYGYIIMNLVGAGIACYASVLLKYVPFILLEGTWTAFSFGALIKLLRKK